MTGRRRAALTVAVLGLGGVLAIGLVPREACACTTPAMALAGELGVDADDADGLRAAAARRWPVGTPVADVLASCARLMIGAATCQRDGAAVRYRATTEVSAFGLHAVAVELDVAFDGEGRVAGVTARRRRAILGVEL